jgi:hypothetical protein
MPLQGELSPSYQLLVSALLFQLLKTQSFGLTISHVFPHHHGTHCQKNSQSTASECRTHCCILCLARIQHLERTDDCAPIAFSSDESVLIASAPNQI